MGTKRAVDARLVIGFWLVMLVLLAGRYLAQSNVLPLIASADDAMRMVSVHDLLGGQAWQDTVEHRDNVPWGASLHWSRLVDAPIAGLVLLFRPFVGAAASSLAAAAWPLLLLLPFLWASATLATRVVGREGQLPGLVLPILCLPVLIEFAPGRVDHHNVQMILVMALVIGTLAGRKSVGGAVLAGLAAATSLAIGMETLGFVVLAIAVFALVWVADPVATRRPVAAFAVTLPVASLLHFLAAVPPPAYFARACDALSITYVVATALSGTALLLAIGLGRQWQKPWARLLLVGGLGALVGAITLWLYPQCLGGPYAEADPRVLAEQFPLIAESQPAWRLMLTTPQLILPQIGTSLVALLIGGFIIWRGDKAKRADWIVLIAFLLVATMVTMTQLRGARFSGMLAVPFGAWLIVAARKAYLARSNPTAIAGLVGGWLLFATPLHLIVLSYLLQPGYDVSRLPGINTAVVGSASADDDAPVKIDPIAVCFDPKVLTALATLPPSALMTLADQSAAVLLHTHHSVVSGGYHRNGEGIKDTLDFFNGPQATALAIARKRHLDYLAICTPLPELLGNDHAARDSFARTYAAGNLFDWLTPISAPGDVEQIFAIDLDGTAK